jgi:steroid delta-isomerase-like uncharacterized protein
MSEQNVAVARRFFEQLWNGRRPELAGEIIHPEAQCESEAGPLVGPEPFLERLYRPFLAAVPDLEIRVEGTVAEGDQVAVLWRATGTHTGEGLGIPPSGRGFTVRGMSWMRIQDGRFVEGRDCYNLGGLLAHLAAPAEVG